ncbi:retrovirus-related pol polyprotein from transposon TNT 1-94 [Tanacetum coccineum]
MSKMTEVNKKQYIADVKEQIRRLMYGSEVTNQVRHSRLMDEFDKFTAKEGESLEYVYERLTTLVNIMDRHDVHPIKDCPKPKVHDAKYFREQMLLAMKVEVGSNLNDEENYFMLDNAYGDETLEVLTAAVISLQIDLINGMISKGVHEHTNHGKLKTVIHTSDDDQIDSNIIFDDPYVENNGVTAEHDSNAHDPYCDIIILAYNVQREAKNKKRLNNELLKQKELIQKDLKTCHKWVKTFESNSVQCDDSNLYTISISELVASSPVCLMSKAISTKSWLWHRRLCHLNFDTNNHLTKKVLVDGLPKFKYDKDHLCSLEDIQ